MSRRKPPTIQTAEQALAFLDYQAAFAKGDTARNCSEIAAVIRDLVAQVQGDYESEWLYVGSPLDVVTALTQRAWDEGVSDDDRTLLETGAVALKASLERNVRLAAVIENRSWGYERRNHCLGAHWFDLARCDVRCGHSGWDFSAKGCAE